jgi:hypothetical protein
MAGLPALLPLLSLGTSSALLAVSLPPTAPPPVPQAAPAGMLAPAAIHPRGLPQDGNGDSVSINGLRQQAEWRLQNGELWLPLEVLEDQLGVTRRQSVDGGLILDWFGQRLVLRRGQERSLADEVAVPASALLLPLGIAMRVEGSSLELTLPTRPLLAIRSRDLGSGGRRIVFDLAGPSALRSGDGQLQLNTRLNAGQRDQLEQLGLAPRQQGDWLTLQAEGRRLSLASPWRLVLDLPSTATASASQPAAPDRDPRLAPLLAQGLAIERQVVGTGGNTVLIHSVRLDPTSVPLEMRPLNRADGMQGLSNLSQLARSEQALIAINGGYFNRINRLPLGALRDDGTWLSGPILNRGAIGWRGGSLPSFGRLSLEESVVDSQGQQWPVSSLNSGYLQKGLARYTAAWGRTYTAISGQEAAVLVRAGRVIQRFSSGELAGGVPLRPGDDLLVARGGMTLPWPAAEALQLRSRPNHPLGLNPYVIGGGPLLLQEGQLVLNGSAEGFSAGFLSQGAPRTVIASDGRQLWLLTLQGVNNAGPTLQETALLLQRQGLRDALNLDGGSSTGLVVGEVHTVKGRGVAASVHNGLGLIPRSELRSQVAGRDDLLAGP